uniref:Zona pellucida sperm-binding protein 3 n=1 Tax=Fundulus heteroclitus TaxID=8078 RepID=A0A147A970_FUNHE
MILIRIAFCLFGGTLAAAVQNLNPHLFSPTDRMKQQRPHQPRFQQPPAVHQVRQESREPLAWRYPEPPAEEEPRYPPNFELKIPEPVQSVSAVCGESSVRVEAKKDLLGIGKPVQAADVTLGGCAPTGEDAKAQILIFESELHGCGSQLLMHEDTITYVFTLHYTPRPLGDSPIVRGREVSVSIECHYQRKHDVSSGLLKPTWTPFSGSKNSEESLYFSLTLMTDDWSFPHPVSQFILGDMMKFEASVKQFHHIPLRVVVDVCVATVVPNVDTVPRYTFLGNSGCLFDSQLTDSSSRFLPRSQDDKVQFEVEAFRFDQDDSGVLYITCSLRALPAATPVSATNKDCSFADGWRESSGSHHVCSCCDRNCGKVGGISLTGMGTPLEEETTVGPVVVKERPLIRKSKYQ